MNTGTARILDQLDAESEFAASWQPPEPGETLLGTVAAIDERQGEYGRYPIVTVQKEDGEELAFHGYRKVARSQLAKARPQLGDQIGIRYLGVVKGKRNEYVGYKVVAEHTGTSDHASFDWSRYDDEASADEKSDVEPGDEGQGATQAALEAERDERDGALSDASIPF